MRNIFLVMLMAVALPSLAVRNQLVLYRTYDDYKAGKGESLGEFMGYDWTLGKLRVFWYADEKKKKVVDKDVSAYYGVTIADRLYRIIGTKPYAMLQQGKFAYYENGFGHMNMIVENEGKAEVEDGKYCYISKDLQSELFDIPNAKAKKAFADRTELVGFFDCIEKLKPNKVEKIRECMKAHN